MRPRPLTLDEALGKVQATLGGVAILDELTIAYPWGWAFIATTPEHARSRKDEDMPFGMGPILVEAATGAIHHESSGAPATWWADQLGHRLRGDAWWRPRTWRACACFVLPVSFTLADVPSSRWRRPLELVETDDFVRLERCRRCGAWWAIDEFDRYIPQAAFHLVDRADWPSAVARARRALVIREHGGTLPEPCAWTGCNERRLHDVVYCAHHFGEPARASTS